MLQKGFNRRTAISGAIDIGFAFTRFKTMTRLKHSRHVLTSAKIAATGFNAVLGGAYHAGRQQIARYGY